VSTAGAPTFLDLMARKRLRSIRRVVLVGSGKGGVGKSFVACGLALRLAGRGLRTALLDVDVHGASVLGYLDLQPPVHSSKNGLEPIRVAGVKAMSVAVFTGDRPVPLAGKEKQELIAKLFALTNWGRLDYLVVDLPPSTGDEMHSTLRLLAPRSSLLLVTTPSPRALSVVSRLRQLADSERLPVAGVVLNMAYEGRTKNRTFPFGKPDAGLVGRVLRSQVISEIPLDPRVNSVGLQELLSGRTAVASAFEGLVDRIVSPEVRLQTRESHVF
jgi:ATP-binding protein involved in chromosome partitioning